MSDCMHAARLPRPMRLTVHPIFLASLVALATSTSTLAQVYESTGDLDTAGLVVEAIAGWGGIIDRSAPVPISLLFRNTSDRNVEGVLKLSDPMRGGEVTIGEVFISPGTTRRFSSIQTMSNWYQCNATLEHRGRILWRRELDIASGQLFDRQVNVVLFVDEGGRALQLPGAQSTSSKSLNTDTAVAGLSGRLFRCVTAKPWQIPNHPGPLVTVHALVFHEAGLEKDLNRSQWKAVAEWVCQGGTVFLHSGSKEIMERLVESAPLQAEAPTKSGTETIRRVGLGAIHEYSASLLSADGSDTRQRIAEQSALLSRNHINTFADSGYFAHSSEGRAFRNRILVFVLFLLYTILVAVAWTLRLNRRQIAAYTITVVVGASILSGLLGGYLRLSKGDLDWVTVTQPGIGGLIQVSSVRVQSAGSRNTRVAITGERADLQFIGRGDNDNRYRYGYRYGYAFPSSGYSPFTLQQNQGPTANDAYQIHVPMTLWGHGRCHAVAYRREFQRLEFELQFQPQVPANNNQDNPPSPQPVNGLMTLKLGNRLPFDLTNCWLVVGTSQAASPSDSQQVNRRQYYGGFQQQMPRTPVDGLIDAYVIRQLSDLPAGTDREEQFPASFHGSHHHQGLSEGWPFGSSIPPTISRMGTSSAWIIGAIKKSPILAIDEPNSDFIELEGTHLFIQEILMEDLPRTLLP